MSRKLFLLALWVSILSLIGCKLDSRKVVAYKEFLHSPTSDVLVHVDKNDCSLIKIKEINTTSRLQSKTTTVLTSEVILESSCEITNSPVCFLFRKIKRIPKHLKTSKNREPYIKDFEHIIKSQGISSFNVDHHNFEYISKGGYFILSEVRK